MRTLPLILGGRSVRVDNIMGDNSLHDFDLVREGERIAVEVRTCVDPVVARFEAALEDHAYHPLIPGLANRWEIRLHEVIRLDGLVDRVAPLIVSLERLGITGFGAGGKYDLGPTIFRGHDSQPDSGRTEVDALLAIGIDTAWSFNTPKGGSIEFLRRSTHASGGSEHRVTAAIDQSAVAKLEVLSTSSALQRDQRHLFVWFDPGLGGMTDFSLWSGRPESAPPPTLPDPIDQCWAATWSSTPGEGIGHVVLWNATKGGPWQYPYIDRPEQLQQFAFSG